MGYLHTDIPELGGYDSGIVLKNLSRLEMHRLRLDESMLAQMWELASAVLADSGGDPDITDSILLSLQGGESVSDGDERQYRILPENASLMDFISGRTGLFGRLILYRFLYEQTASSVEQPARIHSAATEQNRISYMKSAAADKAYLHFSGVLSSCRFSEVHSFSDACEEVYNGLCRYCILPLEVSGDGRLTSFIRMAVTYSLSVAAVCDVENRTSEGMKTTRFGLLCAGREDDFQRYVPYGSELSQFPIQYIELLHTTENSPSLTDILSAAEFCGLRPVSIHSVPLLLPNADMNGSAHSDRLTAPFHVCLYAENIQQQDVSTFLRFIELEAPENIPMGIYGVIRP